MGKAKLLFAVVAVGMLAASIISCDGDGDGGSSTAEDTSEPAGGDVAEAEPVNINGTWSGTWENSDGESGGTLSLQIIMVDNSFSAAMTFTMDGETDVPVVTGTLSGSAVEFGGGSRSFLGTATSNTMNGTVTGHFFGEPIDRTFEMNRTS